MRHIILTSAFIIFLLLLVEPCISLAANVKSPIPVEDVYIRIYRLNENGSRYTDPYNNYYLCQNGDTYWGCTATPTLPFQGINPKILSINDEYLINVIPVEISVSVFHFRAIEAQAIAARTYTYWHIWNDSIINNSTEYQVYIPNFFNSQLGSMDQQKVRNAIANNNYLSYGSNPLFSEFFSDIPLRTITGTQPGLISIDDPISSHPDIIQVGHGHGMSQKGASRWAYGNLGFQGNLDNWSVIYSRTDQILFHYYTGVHLRSDNGSVVSSSYRWNPLRIENMPSFMLPNQSYSIQFQIQNVGTENWTCGYPFISYQLRYWWKKDGNTQIGSNYVSLCGLPIGDPSQFFTITINDLPSWGFGIYKLSFDIQARRYDSSSLYFSQQSIPWPTYDVTVFSPTSVIYLPNIINSDITR